MLETIPAVPKALRTDLVAYAARSQSGPVERTFADCPQGHGYRSDEGGYDRCPICHPGAQSFDAWLSNPEVWPGPDFYWEDCRGPRGRWVYVGPGGLVAVPRDELRKLAEVAGVAPEEELVSGVIRRLDELRQPASPLTSRRLAEEQQRANLLADQCGELEVELEHKRVQVDELRDRVERLEGRR